MANIPEEPNDSTTSTGALGEISQGPGAFESFLDQHHIKILVLGLLAAVGVAGYVVKEGINEGRETAGGNAIHQADDLASLQEILNNHGDTRAAGSATILIAEKQWSDAQQDAAIDTLRNFINSGGDHPAIPTARASLGSKLAQQGKTGDAADVLRDLANDLPTSAHLAPFALIGLGDIALSAGNIEEAQAHYSQARDQFASSPFSDAAIRRLQLLHSEMPTVIDPPTTEPEPTPQAEQSEPESVTQPDDQATENQTESSE